MSSPLPLCSSSNRLVNSILGIDDGFCSQDQLQQTIHLHPTNLEAYSPTSCGITLSMAFPESLASELEKQRLEMDWLLQLESQRLRTIVQEKTRLQAVLLQRYESRIVDLMRQKDKDLEIARSRSLELQNFLVRAEIEAQAWQKMAMNNEAMILDLKNKLDQAKERNLCSPNGAQDAASFCGSSSRECRNQEEEEEQFKKIACKLCNARCLCIVFLPCRHLYCCCKACETLLPLCPICKSVKQDSMEVFLV